MAVRKVGYNGSDIQPSATVVADFPDRTLSRWWRKDHVAAGLARAAAMPAAVRYTGQGRGTKGARNGRRDVGDRHENHAAVNRGSLFGVTIAETTPFAASSWISFREGRHEEGVPDNGNQDRGRPGQHLRLLKPLARAAGRCRSGDLSIRHGITGLEGLSRLPRSPPRCWGRLHWSGL